MDQVFDPKQDSTKSRGSFFRSLLFFNGPKLPLVAYERPQSYVDIGCPVRNVYITHANDGIELGAWHYLPADMTSRNVASPPTEEDSRASLSNGDWPVVLFLHGMGGNRAQDHHRKLGNALAASNIQSLHLDYRGFADSEGTVKPTEQGVVSDARMGFQWLISHGAEGRDITIMGHSLGTGIAAALAGEFTTEGVPFRSLVLVSAYTCIADVLTTYRPGGFLPLYRPLDWIPGLKKFVLDRLDTHFDTLNTISKVQRPTLLVHAADDRELDCKNSERLFERTKVEGQSVFETTETVGERSNITKELQNGEGMPAAVERRPRCVRYLLMTKGKHVNVLYDQATVKAIGDIITIGNQLNHDVDST